MRDLYDPKEPWASYVVNAIKAKELFIKEKSYLVRFDGVVCNVCNVCNASRETSYLVRAATE